MSNKNKRKSEETQFEVVPEEEVVLTREVTPKEDEKPVVVTDNEEQKPETEQTVSKLPSINIGL